MRVCNTICLHSFHIQIIFFEQDVTMVVNSYHYFPNKISENTKIYKQYTYATGTK